MKILFGVFDWGLGHATRDKPLIEALLKRGHSVDIISTGRALKILQSHFETKCKYFDVPSICSPYSKNKYFVFNFTLKIPEILTTLAKARKMSKAIIEKGKYDIVISDCRYDVYAKKSNSYLINHQLRFLSNPVFEPLTELWLKKKMDNYKYVLVPDFEENAKSISGKLSHNLKYFDKNKIKYIGILSHIKKKTVNKDIDYFISVTGTEPHRTILENKILAQVKDISGKIVIAGGNPDSGVERKQKNVTFYSFLDTKLQEEMMNRAKFIITRSGYTTMMELVEFDIKEALLIPYPGQTEQNYISKHFEKQKYFHSVNQDKLNLVNDIEKARGYNGFKASWKTNESVNKFLKIIDA